MNIIYWLLIISSFNNYTFKTNSQPQMEAAVCGNSICESSLGENCETCPGDCPCDIGSECVTGVCTPIVGCGNLYCESFLGESCGSCPGDCPCPPGQICNNGICTFDTSGFVGVNNIDPKTALDISGALAHRSISIEVNDDTLHVPQNVSYAIISGYNPIYDSITVILPITIADGQRLIIKNNTTGVLFANAGFFPVSISQTHSAEFISSLTGGWSLLGKSEDVNTDLFWKISGNDYTSPFYDFLGTKDSSDLIFKTNSNERVRLSSDGNVGIGTEGFTIFGDGGKFNVISKNKTYSGFFRNLPGNSTNFSGLTSAVYGINESHRNDGNYGGYFASYGSNNFSLGENIGVRAFAAGSINGNIGLVATSTNSIYDLAAHFQQGNVRFDNNIGIGKIPVTNIVLDLEKPSYVVTAAKFKFAKNNYQSNLVIGNTNFLNSNNTVGLAIDVGDSNSPNLAIFALGKSIFYNEVAIGVQGFTPGYKLSVDGKIIAEELRIQNSVDWIPWPDYVFAKDYNLRNLKQLEEFINKNNHLPEVPSASEVKENGIEVGDMQRTLLKKIEELTLYIIDQQKQIEELKKSFENSKVNK